VIRCAGWNRQTHWPETGLPFVPTSPAMPSYESVLLYPGICLFEATNVGVGRGTALPFQLIAAPWLRPEELAHRFNSTALAGLHAVPMPTALPSNPNSAPSTPAVRLLATDAKAVRSVAAGLTLLAAVVCLFPAHFRWAVYPTAANPTGEDHFERLIGKRGIREQIERDPGSVGQHLADWTAAPGWSKRVHEVLLYS
jgi:uncharacterized protein YbbC (DUF1343 family)